MAKVFCPALMQMATTLETYDPDWDDNIQYREYVVFEDSVSCFNITNHHGTRYLTVESVSRTGREDNDKRDRNPVDTGFLSRYLNEVEDRAIDLGLSGVYVDTILNEWLPDALARRGYCPDESHPTHPDYNYYFAF